MIMKPIMKIEDYELLLKELYARLPYGVKYNRSSWNFEHDQEMSVVEVLKSIDENDYINSTKVYKIYDIKPYLFPLSSMTSDQREEYRDLCDTNGWGFDVKDAAKVIEWCNRNHFDYNGLIEKSLALDATNLGIYKE